MRWWSIEITCAKCEKICVLVSACFSADQELSYIAQCPKCHEVLSWNVYASALAHRALQNDFTARKVEKMCRNTPLQPSLVEAQPPPHLSDEEMGWLKAMKIDPEDGEMK